MAKKQAFSTEELANDPSLKWCPYRHGETVWSDLHGVACRFDYYEGEGIKLLADSMAPLDGVVGRLTVRRPSVMDTARGSLDQASKEGLVAQAKMIRSFRNQKK